MSPTWLLPWVREGLAATITSPDPGGVLPLPARAALPVTATIGGTGAGDAAVNFRVYGPADVTGIDVRQVIRMDPMPEAAEVESNYFTLVEFDRPDLPWLFTPAAAAKDDRLRPWLCLVVVAEDEGALETPPDRLPILRVDDAAKALPDLGQSWAWAHAQVVTGDADPGAVLRGGDPARTLSRLVCPRRLRGTTAYRAAVVPTFEQGRLAGLERLAGPVDSAAELTPAWAEGTAALELPVYHSWRFTTAEEGDFESLVRSLERFAPDPKRVGRCSVRVRDLPAGLPDLDDTILTGALVAAAPDEDNGDEEPLPSAFTEALRGLLNTPQPSPPGTPPPSELALPPPIYGRWQAAQAQVPPSGGAAWLRSLNLDPRVRAAAGLGADVVIRRQDDLMASAWSQVEDIIRANQLLRQAQLARAAGVARYARISRLSPEALLLLAGPVLSRVVWSLTTVEARLASHVVPAAMVSPAFRRALRPRGPLGRRSRVRADHLIAAVNEGVVVVAGPAHPPPGTVLFDDVHPGRRLCELTPEVVRDAVAPDPDSATFQGAARLQQEVLPRCEQEPIRARPRLPLEAITPVILSALDPELTVVARARARVTSPAGWAPADRLEPIMVAPSFPTPMYRELVASSKELLLPGVGAIPANSVAGLSTNPRFVEAFMAGLNHEMSRELLWRRFPTDQRGTYFRKFWDPAGRVPAPATAAEREDIPEMHRWVATADLGESTRGGQQFVLLIRGDLLRRYPHTVVYLAKAAWTTDAGRMRRQPISPVADMAPGHQDHPERYPLFRGTLEPDITFIGFPVPALDAAGNDDPAEDLPGWFIVLQQQQTELRLGIDVDPPDAEEVTGTWRDLAWTNVSVTASDHVNVAELPSDITLAEPKWGTTSAAQAAITTQQPFRAAIHASDLLEPKAPA